MAAEDRHAKLLRWLQLAAELELATIPAYLVTLLSLQQLRNRVAASLIRGIMIEEMLHLTLVSNVLQAVGGAVRLGPRTIPSYPLQLKFAGKSFIDRQFDVDLAPFSQASIRTFMKIEKPEWLEPRRLEDRAEIELPGLTVGAFYRNIVALIEELDQQTRGGIFLGNRSSQVLEDYYWSSGGKVIPVSDPRTARDALDMIVSQGEGAWKPPADAQAAHFGQPLQMGHYFRFSEIHHGRHYERCDDPAEPPTGPTFEVDYSAVHPFKINPRSSDYPQGSALGRLNDEFNARYTAMLMQLEESLNGSSRTLYTAINAGMRSLAPIAIEMMQTPIDADRTGRTGCPTFEWRAA